MGGQNTKRRLKHKVKLAKKLEQSKSSLFGKSLILQRGARALFLDALLYFRKVPCWLLVQIHQGFAINSGLFACATATTDCKQAPTFCKPISAVLSIPPLCSVRHRVPPLPPFIASNLQLHEFLFADSKATAPVEQAAPKAASTRVVSSAEQGGWPRFGTSGTTFFDTMNARLKRLQKPLGFLLLGNVAVGCK
jgi:hypothetical protein